MGHLMLLSFDTTYPVNAFKVIIPTLLIALFIVSTASIAVTPVNAHSQPLARTVPLYVGADSDGYFEYLLSFNISVQNRGGTWTVLGSNMPVLASPGYPALPFKRIWIGIPPNTEVYRIEVKPVSSRVVRVSNLVRAPPPEVLGYGKTPSTKSSLAYTVWPPEDVAIEQQGWLRDYKVASIAIYPVHYDPLTRMLEIWDAVQVRIYYHVTGPKLLASDQVTIFDVFAKELLFNYEQARAWKAKNPRPVQRKHSASVLPADSYDYVIICKEELSSAFQALASIEEAQGIRTTIVTLEWINDTYEGRDLMEKVHNFLADAYNEWGIVYALLGFDANVTSRLDGVRYMYNPDPDSGYDANYIPGIGNDYTPFDDYFAGLDHNWDLDYDGQYGESRYYSATGMDETDLLYDIIVGRLAVYTADEVNNYVAKLNSMYSTPRSNQILLVGAWLFPNRGVDGAWVCYHQEYEMNTFAAFTPHSQIYRLFESSAYGTANLTAANFRSIVESYQIAIASWHAHGSPDAAWTYYDGAFTSRNLVIGYANTYYPFAWAMSCLTGGFDSDESGGSYGTSLGEAWTRYAAGGIGYYAYSRVTWGWAGGNNNNTDQYGVVIGLTVGLNCLTWKVLNRTRIVMQGPLIYLAKMKYYEGGWGYSTWSAMQGSASDYEIERKSVVGGVLFGDPCFMLLPNGREYWPPSIEVVTPIPAYFSSEQDVVRIWFNATDRDGSIESVTVYVEYECLTSMLNSYTRTETYSAIRYNATHWYIDLPVPFGEFRLYAVATDNARFQRRTPVYKVVRPLPTPYSNSFDIEKQYLVTDDVPVDDALWNNVTYAGPVAHSGIYYWWTGEYENNADWRLTSPAIDISTYSVVNVTFWHHYSIESGWDYGYLEMSFDGGSTWDTVASYTGTVTSWTKESFEFTPNHWWDTGPYVNNADWRLTSPAISLGGTASVTLSFDTAYNIETGWDYGYVEYSFDGSTWNQIDSLTGSSGWVTKTYTIDTTGQTTLYIRFRLVSDSIIAWQGWKVDNIKVENASGTVLFYDDVESGNIGWTTTGNWHINEITFGQLVIRFRLVSDSIITWDGWYVDDIAVYGDGSIVFYDDVESGNIGWTTTGNWHIDRTRTWHIVDTNYYSPSYSWFSDYANNYDTALELSTTIDASTYDELILVFKTYYSIEEGYDYGSIDISLDGGATWTEVGYLTGSSNGWITLTLDLTPMVGGRFTDQVKIRFHFVTDYINTEEGWYVDDITLIGVRYPGGGLAGWRFCPGAHWHITDLRSASPEGSLWCGFGNGYGDLWYDPIYFCVNISRTEGTLLMFEFNAYSELCSGDLAILEVSLDEGNSWNRFYIIDKNATWEHVSVMLNDYAPVLESDIALFRLRFISDESGSSTGIFIDDLSIYWTSDTQPPTVRILSPSNNSLCSGSTTVVWEVGDNIRVSEIRVLVDGALYATLPGDAYSCEVTDLTSGAHTIEVVAYDIAGLSSSDQITVYSDVQSPTIEILEPTEGAVVPSTFTIRWNATDDVRIDHIEISINGSELIDVGTHASHTLTGLPEGELVIEVTAYDAIGNYASDTLTVVVDTSLPGVTITSPSEGSYHASSSVTVEWIASDNQGIASIEVWVDDRLLESLPGGASSYTITGLADGEHEVEIRAIDQVGLSSSDSISFIVDTTAPTVAITHPSAGDTIEETDVLVVWEASDNADIDHVEIRIDGGEWIDVGTATSYLFTNLTEGTHTVEVRVFDLAGNEASSSVTFEIVVPAAPAAPTVPWHLALIAGLAVGGGIATAAFLLLRRRKSREEASISV